MISATNALLNAQGWRIALEIQPCAADGLDRLSGCSSVNRLLFQVLSRRQRAASGCLKIKDVNDLLDRLASAERREEKTAVLAELISKTNALEMKWILMIIIKDLKLGVSEKSLFHEFHPDAEDMFNVTCDLKMVCEKLKDRSERSGNVENETFSTPFICLSIV
eukprot:Gb_32666 [translate_table: standard]